MPPFGIQPIFAAASTRRILPSCWHCARNPALVASLQTTSRAIKPVDSQLIGRSRYLGPRTCPSPRRYRQTEMLRITLQEDGTLWRLHLAGRLAGAWVAETENTWRSALVSGRPVEIDIREVTGLDEAGRCLLRAMNREGARLIAKGVAMEALVEEITGISVRRRRA